MYHVAVCDDENIFLEDFGRMCGKILREMDVRHQISMFSSIRGLREAMEAGERFDLLCLDILMPGKNGIEFAYEFRQKNDEISILFITSSTDFLLEGYGVRPIQYLLKPVKWEELRRVLADDIRLNHTPTTVNVTVGKKNHGPAAFRNPLCREPQPWLRLCTGGSGAVLLDVLDAGGENASLAAVFPLPWQLSH